MAAPQNIFKITWTFKLLQASAAVEEAQFGIWFELGTPAPANWDTYLEGAAQNAADAFQSTFTTSQYSNLVVFNQAIATRYQLSNLAILNEQAAAPGTAWSGSDSGASLPWQLSCCIGLYSYTPGTFIAHNRRRRGRIYLPPFAASQLDSTGPGNIKNAEATGAMEDVRQLTAAVATYEPSDPGHGCLPVVYSRAAAEVYNVTDLATDIVLDTQRRRIKSENRARLSATWHV